MPDNAREIFVRNLNELMERRDISQADIIRELGVTSAAVSNWCTGKKYPRIDIMQKIADMLGVGLSDLISENGLQNAQDRDRLEALHQNPRLGLLFDHAKNLGDDDIAFMEKYVSMAIKERDGE